MSDISGQFINASFNYVLQSDITTGIVYRIGGAVPVNPIFLSGLTVNSGFTFANGTEANGYVLTSDAFGNARWSPVSGSSSGNFVHITGDTMTGSLITPLLSATTISGTTFYGDGSNLTGIYQIFVTGGTYNNGTAIFTNNTGGTFNVTGFNTTIDSFVTGLTYTSPQTINLNQNRTDQYSALTINLSGLSTGNTFITGVSSSNQYLFLDRNDGITLSTLIQITGGSDTYVTGLTYTSPQTINLNQNRTDQYSSFTITLSGLSTADTNTFVTGATSSNQSLFLTRNDGVIISTLLTITGDTDTYVTGITYTSPQTITLTQNRTDIYSSFTTTLSGLSTGDTFITGFTYNNSVLTVRCNDNTNLSVTITGFVSTDTFVTGFSYSNNILTITNSTGGTNSVLVNTMTGLTVNGTLSTNIISATTYQNLPLDIRVTGGTLSNGTATFVNNTGGTFNVTGFTSGSDSYVTGFTYTSPQTINLNQNRTDQYSSFTITLSGLSSGDTFVTGLTYSSATLTVKRNDNVNLSTTITGFTTDDIDLLAYQALGSAMLGQTVGSSVTRITGNGALSNQEVRFVAVYLAKAATITGVKWWQHTQGNYTANNYNGVGLYSYSAGTLTMVASSTTDNTIWSGATNSFQSKAFASTYSAAIGIYYVGFLYCRSAATVAPVIGATVSFAGTAISSADFTNSAKITGFVSSLTTLPSSQASSGITVAGTGFWFAIY